MHPYAHLFQPLRLGRTVLKNRIEAAPVSVANLTPRLTLPRITLPYLNERPKEAPPLSIWERPELT